MIRKLKYKYYFKTIRQMKIKRSFVLFFTLLLFTVILNYYLIQTTIPIITLYCENSVEYTAKKIVNGVVVNRLDDMKYENLIVMNKTENADIITLSANIKEMNNIIANIVSEINEELEKIDKKETKMPLTTIFNIPVISGYGPKIKMVIVPLENVEARFVSEFEEAGINQVRHKIYIEIKTTISIIAPFVGEDKIYTSEILVAEMVIVGKVPSTYYRIENIDEMDSLNIGRK